jgi:hypothetical protein
MPTFDILVTFSTEETARELQDLGAAVAETNEEIGQTEQRQRDFQADSKAILGQTQASIRSAISKVRRLVQLTSFFIEATGVAVDQSLMYMAEAVILTIEAAMNMRALLAASSVGLTEILQFGMQMALIVSLVQLSVRLHQKRTENLEQVRARVGFLRGLSFRQTYYG